MPDPRPLRDSMAAALGAVLGAGVLVAIGDVISATSSGGSSGAGEMMFITLGLYALPCLALALALGVLLFSWRATFGERALRRALAHLRADREADARAVAILMASSIAAVAYMGFVAALAKTLVAGVQRQSVGAVLFAAVAVGTIPIFALAALPVYRLTRRIGRFVPRIGPAPGVVVLAVGTPLLGIAMAIALVTKQLDWRALDLAALSMPVWFALALGAWMFAWYGPGKRLRVRIPRRGVIATVAAVIALVLPFTALRGKPSDDALTLLTEHSTGARMLVNIGQSLHDADGDGYSTFLGGTDCDDSNPNVHPDAREIPGNGIDDNCIDGDAPRRDEPAAPEPQPDTSRRYAFDGNLLFIMLDTTRGDRLGVTGYTRGGKSLTPNLDALAARSTYFSNAIAQAPNTARSLPSMLTSQFPTQVAVDKMFKNFSVTKDENVTVFEVLQTAGLTTLAFSSHYYFNVNPGIYQGFDQHDNTDAWSMGDSGGDIAEPRIVSLALKSLQEMARARVRFAMFVHLFGPHSSYLNHDEFPAPSGKAGFRARYDYEIAYSDKWIGRLLDAIEALGIGDKTMIVVVSDHGEGFGEHRIAGQKMYYHGRTLYQDVLHVPLIIHLPGVPAGRIDRPVMVIDAAPTIVQAMKLERPTSFRGRSLLAAMLGDELPPRPAYAELLAAPYWKHSAKAMITGDGKYKVILRQAPHKKLEIYDLEADAGETKNLARNDKELAQRLERELKSWMERL